MARTHCKGVNGSWDPGRFDGRGRTSSQGLQDGGALAIAHEEKLDGEDVRGVQDEERQVIRKSGWRGGGIRADD